jgi:hypothetical protein
MKLGTHMPDGEMRKPIDIEICRTNVKVTTSLNRTNICSIFRCCDLDLCPTNLNIDRLPPFTIRHVCTKFHLDLTFRS